MSIKFNYEEGLESMIESCFTYGKTERDSYHFKRYIEPYIEKIGSVERFNEIYEAKLADLKQNCTINFNVHTDSEGVTYHSLVKK